MKHKNIFDYIIKRADVRELEDILIALQAVSNLSPAGVAILSAVIKKAFEKEVSAQRARETLKKANLNLQHIFIFKNLNFSRMRHAVCLAHTPHGAFFVLPIVCPYFAKKRVLQK